MQRDFISLDGSKELEQTAEGDCQKPAPELVLFVINVLLEERLNVINTQ